MDSARSDHDGKPHFEENEASSSTKRQTGEPIAGFTVLRSFDGKPLRKAFALRGGKIEEGIRLR
jgi:hypothetical protein